MNGYKLIRLREFLAVLLAVSLVITFWPVAVSAARPGEADPTKSFFEWRDDEIFLTTAPFTWSGYTGDLSAFMEPSSDLNNANYIYYDFPASSHDAMAAAAGHMVYPDKESVAQAFRSGTNNLQVSIFQESAVTTLPDLAARVSGCTDFFDIAAGDLDGFISSDWERRDEVILVYAQPSADNKLPVQVAVLNFADFSASNIAPVVTTALASSKLDAASIISGATKPADNALAVAVGDFDNNGLKEIAVAYLSSPLKMNVDIFRYTANRDAGGVSGSLQRVGSGYSEIGGGLVNYYKWVASLSAAAGDFNGDGRDELAVGTAWYLPANNWNVYEHIKMFRIGTGINPWTVNQASPQTCEPLINPSPGMSYATGRIRIAAGLFKFDPANGFTLQRRQLAVVYSDPHEVGNPVTLNKDWVSLRTIEYQNDTYMTAQLNPPVRVVGKGAPAIFSLAAGRFQGSVTQAGGNPCWSLALNIWDKTDPAGYSVLSLYQTNPGAAPTPRMNHEFATTTTLPTSGARVALTACDYDGNSVFLGAPVHFTVGNLLNTDVIMQEPPKHAYYDESTGQIVNISRVDNFNVEMKTIKNEKLTTTTKDISSYAVGGSVSASAGVSATFGGDFGIYKGEVKETLEVKASVGYDYENSKSSLNSSFSERNVEQIDTTQRDDAIIGRFQVLDVWRYRIYGLTPNPNNPDRNPFMDIIIPGGKTVDVEFHGGAMTVGADWYQPIHENGNVLSYPSYSAGYTPPDLPDAAESPDALMYGNTQIGYGGSGGSVALNFTKGSGTGTERSYSHKLNANTSITHTAEASASMPGFSFGGSYSLGLEAHGSKNWSNAETSDNLTSDTTGITLNRPPATRSYIFYPFIYTATDGTIKATYTWDPPAPNTPDGIWWRQTYQAPDLALNLPSRFISTAGGDWTPRMDETRKTLRGFFVRTKDLNPVTGEPELLSGAIRDGATVRLEARVYNFSLVSSVPTGMKAKFSYVPFDGLWETGPRTTIGYATLPAMAPREMTVASVEWNTQGLSGAASQQYRIYVELDPDNQLTNEKYETEPPATIDPGQNNEGFGYVTVAKVGRGAPAGNQFAHVSLAQDAVAAINPDGKIVTGNVQACLNQPLRIRVTVTSDIPTLDSSQVLLYDGDPDKGGKLIGLKSVFAGSTTGTPVWFEWMPASGGAHRLYAKVLQNANDSAPGNNIAMLNVLEVIPGVPASSDSGLCALIGIMAILIGGLIFWRVRRPQHQPS